MKKNDLQSLILSIVINVIIILLLPGIKLPMEDEGKISVGLIQFKEENKKVTPKKPEKTEEVKPEEKPQPPVAVEPEKPVEEAPKEVQQEVVKETPKKVPVPDAIPVPEIDVETLVSTLPQERRRPVIQEEKREERVFEKEETRSEKQEIRGADLQKKEIAQIDAAPIISEGEPQKIVAKASSAEGESDLAIPLAEETDKLEGLPQGVKDIGSPDGNITGRWDPGNVLPRYPESAELKGQTGTVRLRVYVEENGSVNKVEMIGSGVPELNRSIEEVARTWKIYLTKNGQRIYGNVTLEIPFRLLRGE